MPKSRKQISQASKDELEALSQEFSHLDPAKDTKPLTAEDIELHRKAGLGGRPRVGEGALGVMISLERRLLRDIDAEAARRRISRSELLAMGARRILERTSSNARGARPENPPVASAATGRAQASVGVERRRTVASRGAPKR